MSKTTLLLAASAAAILAVGTNASAGDITGTGSFPLVRSTGDSTPYKLANELRFSTSASATGVAATRGQLTYNFTPTSGFPTGQTLLLTLDVSGSIFSATSATPVAQLGDCEITSISAANGVVAGNTSATYLVTLGGTCTGTANGLAVSLPIQATGATTVTAGAGLQSSFGSQTLDVDGGRKAATFVTLVDAYQASITAGTNAVADVAADSSTGGAYSTLASSGSSSYVTVTVDTSANDSLATATPASTASISGIRFDAVAAAPGSFTGFNLVLEGYGQFSATSTATQTTLRRYQVDGSPSSQYYIAIVDNTDTATAGAFEQRNAVIADTDINLTVFVDLLADNDFATSTGTFVDFQTGPQAIAGVDRNGTSFVAPWIALNTTGSNSSIRLGNNGSNATGPITVTLLSDNAAGAPFRQSVVVTQALLQAGTLNAQGGINAGDVITIAANRLAGTDYLGTTASNGDLSIAIEAQSATISGKVRVQQASGQIFESSLGNLSTAVQ